MFRSKTGEDYVNGLVEDEHKANRVFTVASGIFGINYTKASFILYTAVLPRVVGCGDLLQDFESSGRILQSWEVNRVLVEMLSRWIFNKSEYGLP